MNRSLLRKIADHVDILAPDKRTDRPMLGVIRGKSSTLIVDAGNSPSHAQLLLDGLAGMDIPKHRYLCITHGHWDHVFGSSKFDVPIFASRETRLVVQELAQLDWSNEAIDKRIKDGLEIEFCRDMIQAELPCRDDLIIKPPDVTFNSPLELDLGGICCQLIPIGGDHSSDSSIVYIQEDKVIFLGDCLYPNIHSGVPCYTTRKLLPLLDQLLKYEADHYLASHDSEPMIREQIEEYQTITRLVGDMIKSERQDRESVLRSLQTTRGLPPVRNILELVDGLLAGQ